MCGRERSRDGKTLDVQAHRTWSGSRRIAFASLAAVGLRTAPPLRACLRAPPGLGAVPGRPSHSDSCALRGSACSWADRRTVAIDSLRSKSFAPVDLGRATSCSAEGWLGSANLGEGGRSEVVGRCRRPQDNGPPMNLARAALPGRAWAAPISGVRIHIASDRTLLVTYSITKSVRTVLNPLARPAEIAPLGRKPGGAVVSGGSHKSRVGRELGREVGTPGIAQIAGQDAGMGARGRCGAESALEPSDHRLG